MGVRVEAGVGRRGAWRVRAAAPRPSRGGRRASGQSSCRAAPRSIAAERPERHITRLALYYATRVPRSLVLWWFMMVRHESARYADVP